MSEVLPKGGWKLQRDSLSKLIVSFYDGNKRTFYSLDWRHKYSRVRSREQGIVRLRALVKKYGRKAGIADLYDLHTGEHLFKFFEGDEVEV